MLLWEGQKRRLCCGSLKQQLPRCSAGPVQTERITRYCEKRTQRGDESTLSCITDGQNGTAAKRNFNSETWLVVRMKIHDGIPRMATNYCRIHASRGVEEREYMKLSGLKTTVLPHSVLSTCTVTKLTDKKVMRSEEMTLRYQNKDPRLVFEAYLCLQKQILSVISRLINEQHAAATFQVKVLSVSVLVTC